MNLTTLEGAKHNPPTSDWPRGICYGCKGELWDVAYKHRRINATICPSCMWEQMKFDLRDIDLDALDGFQQPERADLCDCGNYTTSCRCR